MNPASDHLILWMWNNREYLTAKLLKQKDGVPYFRLQDKEKFFVVEWAIGDKSYKEICDSKKPESRAVWDVIERKSQMASLRIVGGKK